MSGYARMDFRVTPAGELYVLEANPNPNLTADEDFAQAALVAGIAYPEMLDRIIALGLSYQAEWRAFYG